MKPHERITQARERCGLTREDLAKRLNLSYWAVAKYETGERVPPQDVLVAMANIFDVSTDYLLGRTDDPRPPADVENPILPIWLKKLPPDMQAFLEEESKRGWPFLRLARGVQMQDLGEEEVRAIVETWMDAKKRHAEETNGK